MAYKKRKFQFTNTSIDRLKPEAKMYECRDTKSTGLILRVYSSGRKVYYITYINADKKQQRFNLGKLQEFDNPEAARIAAGKLWDKIRNQGANPQAEKIANRAKLEKEAVAFTLGNFIEQVYSDYATQHQKAGVDAIARLKSAFKSLLGIKLNAVQVSDITQWRTARLKSGNKPQTVNRYMDDLRSCFNHALDLGIINAHPFDQIPKKTRRVKAEQASRVRYLGQHDDHENMDTGERERFLKAIELPQLPKYMRPICQLAMNTGMRRGEIFKLRWQDINFKEGNICFHASNTKSSKTRYSFLTNTTESLLKDWRKTQGSVVNFGGLVFPNPVTGNALTTIKRSWKTITDNAQLTDFRFHDLRHDFASQLVMNGGDLNTVRELLGHSDISMTLRYAHLAPQHKADVVKLLDSIS